MEFEEFLKNWTRIRIFSLKARHKEEIKCLDLIDLGEWAWDYLNEAESISNIKGFTVLYIASKKEEWLFDFDNLEDYFTEEMGHHYKQIWNQAVACLGKNEIEKRLKELKL